MKKYILIVCLCMFPAYSCAVTNASAGQAGNISRKSDGVKIPPREYVKYLLDNKTVVYWYTNAADGDIGEVRADGIFDAATIIEAGKLSAETRNFFRAFGILPVAHAKIQSGAGADSLYSVISAPLKEGWDAVAIDEFPRAERYASIIDALKKIRKDFPGKVIIAWAQPGAPMSDLAPYIDLFLIEPAGAQDGAAYLRESNAPNIALRLADASAAIMKSGGAGADALGKSVAVACTCDLFDDSATPAGAFACNNRGDVDFRKFLDNEVAAISRNAGLFHGVAFFASYRTRPETIRFANALAGHYAGKPGAGFMVSGGGYAGNVRDSGFDDASDEAWEYEGTGVAAAPIRADLPSGERGLRMNGAGQSCNTALQKLVLEPGATYLFSGYLAGNAGGESASVWIYDADNGRDYFNAFQSVKAPGAMKWTNVRMAFTLPYNTKNVAVTLSDCDAAAKQTIWWDFIEVEKILPHGDTPAIISAVPIYNTLEGYGFRLQWTHMPHQNVSHSLVQYSIDGAHWVNIASEFDGVYTLDWLPSGMTTLPFDKVPPGQTFYFRVKIFFWGDKESEWSTPYSALMPMYEKEKTPELSYVVKASLLTGDKDSDLLRFAWLAPDGKPDKYEIMCLDGEGQWKTLAAAADANSADVAYKQTGDAPGLFRIRASYKDEEALSNIAPQIKQ